MQLNVQQEQAASHVNGPCLVTACPGSGKTRVLVQRTCRLISMGIKPSSILAVTFTNKAAMEMKERLKKELGEQTSKQVFVGTFHRLCSSILRVHGESIGYRANMTILDDDGQCDLMSQVSRQLGFEYSKPQIREILKNTNDTRENLENDDQMYKRFLEFNVDGYAVAKEYLKRLTVQNLIDFSGLLERTVHLFETVPAVLQTMQRRWQYFQVDETQDTNGAQFRIINLLASHTKNVFIVGDLDQSIYSWRGARIENVRDFHITYPDAKTIMLGKNYRSTPEIVSVAGKLIAHNTDRIAATFQTDNPSGLPVVCRQHTDDREESEYVARTIKMLIQSGKFTYKDIAIFYRMNAMSRAMEMALINSQIPHTLIGSFSFFDRKEVKDCLSMLKFLINPSDGVSFHRIANKPKRSMGDVAVGKIELYSQTHNVSILQAIKEMQWPNGAKDGVREILNAFDFAWQDKTIAECLTHVLSHLKYQEYLDSDPDTTQERQQNIQELTNDMTRYGAEHEQSIVSYLETAVLMSSSDKSADGNSVSMMSSHASKGLEFPVVFVLGVEQGILPHTKAVEERDDGLEEERRLAYVAMTRAEKLLVVNHCRRRQSGYAAKGGKLSFKASFPSQFLYECGLLERNNVARKDGEWANSQTGK